MPSTPSVMNTGAFSQLISRDFRKVAFDEFVRREPEFDKVFNIDTMDGAYIREGQAAGLGPLQVVGENQPIPYDAFVQGKEKTLTPIDYALALAITHDMYMDDLTGIMKKAAAELGKSAAYSRELIAWDVFNSGFVTTYRTGIDGYALFYASHPLFASGSSVYGNTATGASSALTMTSLQAALDSIEMTTNEKNIPIQLKPRLLLVPPQLRWKAQQLLKSEFNPENANHEINTTPIMDLQFMVCHWLTSTTNWFILCDQGVHDLRYIWREKFQVQNSDDFNTGAALFKGTMRCLAGFVNWRGVYGSAGA